MGEGAEVLQEEGEEEEETAAMSDSCKLDGV